MEGIQINKTGWDLDLLKQGKSFEEKREDWKKATENFISKWKGRKDYLENPDVLKEALDDYEEWNKNYGVNGDEFYYYWLKNKQNQDDPEVKAKLLQIDEFSKIIENGINFFEINLTKIPEENQKLFLQSENLKGYKNFLEVTFKKAKYTLSENEEKIMNLKSTASHELWEKMLSEFLSKEEREILNENGEIEKKSFPEMFGLLNNKNKKIRDKAAEAFNDIIKKNLYTAEAEINAILLDKKVNDEIRGFSRPDESRHLIDDVNKEVIDSLIESVSQKFEIAKKYYELKTKLFKVPKLQYHERNVEYGSIDKKYTYEGSVKLIGKVFKNLDAKFYDILKDFVENGKIDVFPKKGKDNGAFCIYILKSQPVYVLLNHENLLRDVETFAHEMGHAINDELMREKQNSLNFETSTATAEVASTFMEDFVLEEIMKDADEELKLFLMMQKLNSDISSIFRQIAFYNFELELHSSFREKGFLTKEEIGKIFKKHMESYMGEFVEQSEGSENWWTYINHFRRFFYVYSYASGLLISKALQKKVKENPRFIEEIKKFLSAGSSKSPKDIFLDLGIDITKKEFWEEGINEIEKNLTKTEELAKKLGKI